MKPEQQRIAIAEWQFGWTDFDWLKWCDAEGIPVWEGRRLHGATPKEGSWHLVPDYLNDLNAMWEAEERLNQEQREEYVAMLTSGTSSEEVCDLDPIQAEWNLLHATASQRAETLVRYIGKWQDDATQQLKGKL